MIRFSKYLWIYFILSVAVIVPGLYHLAVYTLRPSIDFTGGTLLDVRFSENVTEASVSGMIQKSGVTVASVQQSGDNSFIFRLKPDVSEKTDELVAVFEKELSKKQDILRDETVGPVLGKELMSKALYASVLAVLAILSYVAYAFKDIKFGVCAVIALFHDIIVTIGLFAIFGKWYGVEVDTLFVTAILTTMSFSVHDTIVVFDRIREYLRRGEKRTFEETVDRALNETMGRSLTNSLTIFFMLLALVLMGGETVHWFAMALLIGTISGTYSSPFVATPILILWDRWEKRNKLKVKS